MGSQVPSWAGRVPQWKIRRLYVLNASGIYDEGLIDDVGMSLLMRCIDCLRVGEAEAGQAPCPICDVRIPHHHDKAAELRCLGCGWRLTWQAYLKSYQDKQLSPGGMKGYFAEFARDYPRAVGLREKMRLIDLLIHRFHKEYSGKTINDERPGRAGCVNLIGGRLNQVIRLLDDLAYGAQTDPRLRETRDRWRRFVDREKKAAADSLARKRASRGGSGKL